jgi:hypothetical protein
MTADALEVMNELRDFMFERVYLRAEAAPAARPCHRGDPGLVDHFIAHPAAVPATYRHPQSDPVTAAIDYVSGMTDWFASAGVGEVGIDGCWCGPAGCRQPTADSQTQVRRVDARSLSGGRGRLG